MRKQSRTGAELVVVPDGELLALRAADLVIELAGQAIAERGIFTIALSGGSTPRSLFEVLASGPYRDRIGWDHWQIFFSDERFVLPDSPDSNFHTADVALLSRVPVPESHRHGVQIAGLEPDESADLYEQDIRKIVPVVGDAPRFDLILLGLGADGHTASLFPQTGALATADRLVVSNFVDKLDSWRITFTYALINAAAAVVFLVKGSDKAERVAQVLSGDDRLPATGVHPTDGRLIWLLDGPAAADLQLDGSGV